MPFSLDSVDTHLLGSQEIPFPAGLTELRDTKLDTESLVLSELLPLYPQPLKLLVPQAPSFATTQGETLTPGRPGGHWGAIMLGLNGVVEGMGWGGAMGSPPGLF